MKRVVKNIFLLLLWIALTYLPAYAGTQDLVTAQYHDASILDVLDSLSKVSATPLIVSCELRGNVTAHFSDQPFETVLNQLAQAFNFTWYSDNGTVIVAPSSTMATTVRTFKVKYLDLANLKNKFSLFIDGKKIAINADDSTITIDSTPTNIKKAQQIIETEDLPPRQIEIQAKFLEISREDEEKLGLNYTWNSYSQGTAFNLGLTATLTANDALSNSKLITRPSILAYNGRKASIVLSDKVPILNTTTTSSSTSVSAEYKEVGVTLEVTPRVSQDDDDNITMDVHPVVSLITGYTTLNENSYPTISSREATTTVRIKNGQTLIIGGLMKEDDIQKMTKIPVLSNLPLFGKLFQYHDNNKVKREIIVLITPRILNTGKPITDITPAPQKTNQSLQ